MTESKNVGKPRNVVLAASTRLFRVYGLLCHSGLVDMATLFVSLKSGLVGMRRSKLASYGAGTAGDVLRLLVITHPPTTHPPRVLF